MYNGGEDSIENRIWCLNIGGYLVFGSIVGSDSYNISPPGIAPQNVDAVPKRRKTTGIGKGEGGHGRTGDGG